MFRMKDEKFWYLSLTEPCCRNQLLPHFSKDSKTWKYEFDLRFEIG